MSIFAIVFFVLILMAIYHHIGYMAVLKLMNSMKNNSVGEVKPSDNQTETPTIAILMCAYNEAEYIEEKLHNLGSLLYPNHKYDIHIYFDGCTDNTYELAKSVSYQLESNNVHCNLHLQIENKGKTAGLNTLISMTRDRYDILVFTDVSALLSIDALNKIEQDFRDNAVAVSTGQYTLQDSAPISQQSYWQYQNTLKRLESNVGAVIGVPGAMFAVRSELVTVLEPNAINDDFILSMRALAHGGNAIINDEVVMYECDCDDQVQDYTRRERVGAGNWQQIKLLMPLMNFKLGWTSINFLSHKVLRGLMPILLLGMYLALIAEVIIYQTQWSMIVSSGLLAVHLTSLFKFLFNTKKRLVILDQIAYVLNSYWIALIGIVKFEYGYFDSPWKRVSSATTRCNGVKCAKRVLDIIGASVGILLVSPIMLGAAMAIKLSSKGPVLFKQLRVGESTDEFVSLFYVYKFRSMVVDAEAKSGAVWASKNDPRITPIGSFLRKTRIDELPQLWNVLIGEMSLIGPRPERPVFYAKLEKSIPYFCHRTYGLKPGISGLAQVMNGYDESVEDARSKIGWDYAYVLSMSSPLSWIKMEFTILFKTIQVVVLGKGQ
ncbi:sugar transferase [Pseudoalteromonas sp. MMG005]|uniref:sugar transferase n=1 Tax=Pseudoalteromonas sp. MMG005 TaxID=2822682 RepID=UPI001B39DB16|nr:sugar transferase [Pseudoalteromonas sp. MMG005]MBQ4846084.1 sugar transferase [Pseudoalteromonas sp. MMG005]